MEKENKSTVAATTAAGRSLRPNSKNAEKIKKIKEDATDDTVAEIAKILGTGKGFGGWTDTVEEDTYKKHVKKQHASREREENEDEASREREEKEDEVPLVIHGPDGTRKNPQYSKFIYSKDVNKNESVELDEMQQLDEIPFLAPIAATVGRKVVGGRAKKAIGGVVGSIFKPRKAAGEPGKA